MIASFYLVAFLVYEFFMPEWQKNVRHVAREVASAMTEVSSFDDDEVFRLNLPPHCGFFVTLRAHEIHSSKSVFGAKQQLYKF